MPHCTCAHTRRVVPEKHELSIVILEGNCRACVLSCLCISNTWRSTEKRTTSTKMLFLLTKTPNKCTQQSSAVQWYVTISSVRTLSVPNSCFRDEILSDSGSQSLYMSRRIRPCLGIPRNRCIGSYRDVADVPRKHTLSRGGGFPSCSPTIYSGRRVPVRT